MGLPARKPAQPARGAGRVRKPHLRLVSATARPLQTAPAACKRDRQAASGPADAACKSAFQIATVALLALTVLALARVTLSAKAAEASMVQLQLQRSIKAENRVGDRLELDRSLLVTPSRIESIAAGLRMTKAPAVRYIAVPDASAQATGQPSPSKSAVVSTPKAERTFASVLSAALEVTQKEARTLLVGDVGVAASR